MHNFINRAKKEYYELQFAMFKSFEEVDALVEFEEQGQHENAMKVLVIFPTYMQLYATVASGSIATRRSPRHRGGLAKQD